MKRGFKVGDIVKLKAIGSGNEEYRIKVISPEGLVEVSHLKKPYIIRGGRYNPCIFKLVESVYNEKEWI